jgi:hypothetical protein
MTSRKLRFAATQTIASLRVNAAHEFAHKHAISIFPSNSVYTMIPKNGCSTMRLSIALENGAIDNVRHWRWIHKNNETFRPSLRELAMADYTFVVLRCPYRRLASCFLDKFVSRRSDAWIFQELINDDVELARLTFRRFCRELANPVIRSANMHWRPQVDFMVYQTYDDYFSVKRFAEAAARLKERIGFDLVDARPYVRHDSSHYKVLPHTKSFADTEVWQIEQIMLEGLRPAPESLFDDELRGVVESAYAADLALFRHHFPGVGMFDGGQMLAVAS